MEGAARTGASRGGSRCGGGDRQAPRGGPGHELARARPQPVPPPPRPPPAPPPGRVPVGPAEAPLAEGGRWCLPAASRWVVLPFFTPQIMEIAIARGKGLR